MKTTFYLHFTVALLLLSCSQSPEDKLKSDKEEYRKKATVFFQNLVDTDEKKEVLGFEIVSIDSISDLSESEAGMATLAPLRMKYKRSIKYAQKLLEIDKIYGTGVSSKTSSAIDDASDIEDSLNNQESRMLKLSDDIVGKQVFFTLNLLKSDGTKTKGVPYRLCFDLDNDLPSDWNSWK